MGILLGGSALLLLGFGGYWVRAHRQVAEPKVLYPLPTRPLALGRKLAVWWDLPPASVQARTVVSGSTSNIHPADYAGPESCRECHARNYELWSKHSHHWMNALANDTTVKGDFSSHSSISYLGGRATFSHGANGYEMHLERDGVRRTYRVAQTIGSRFFQYYIGRLIEGPEPKDHHFYTKDHVLQFGYWLDQKEWVPTVHIGTELPDGRRPDPFAPPESGKYYAEYAVGCAHCHTTFPLGDLLGRRPETVGAHSPLPLHFSLGNYLAQTHPPEYELVADQLKKQSEHQNNPIDAWEAPRYAVTLGISCEACHLGAKEHVDSRGSIPPRFFPSSPHLLVESGGAPLEYGRTRANVNWACGRCHTGRRPQFAAGMSTWNSVEYADAMRGSCYSQLRCVDCHNPHKAIGPEWALKPDQDDALCLKCHTQFEPAAARAAHTHHSADSTGSHCMDCHMPRINESLQYVVRTHMIYSPTRADMIEANHPNACNLCHTDRSIDWTLQCFEQWYGKRYDQEKLTANYPERGQSAALGWLRSPNPAVRLVAAEALTRARDMRALPQLLEALNDSFLLNRQFAWRGLEKMLNLHPGDFGYHFYMSPQERRQPLAALRAKLLRPGNARGE